MIVEDNRTNLTVLTAIVGKIPGCHVEGFDSPTKAMTRAFEMTFDLILVDYVMPEMNGIDLLATLRAKGRNVPFGFVTSEGSLEMRERAASAGAMFLISKPFTPEAFKEALEPVLG